MMAMHKNHLQRVVVGAMDSLHQQQNHMYYSHQPQMEELNLKLKYLKVLLKNRLEVI